MTESVADTEPAIRIRGLSKTYGRRPGSDGERALKSVDLDVREGEFLVLLGPSGCGKTTLLRCIAGLELPDARVDRDRRPSRSSTRAASSTSRRRTRPVSMIFQSYALWPHMTAFKNVAYPARVRRHVGRAEINGAGRSDVLDTGRDRGSSASAIRAR